MPLLPDSAGFSMSPNPSAQEQEHLRVKEPEKQETTGREMFRLWEGSRVLTLGEGQAAHSSQPVRNSKGCRPQEAKMDLCFCGRKDASI